MYSDPNTYKIKKHVSHDDAALIDPNDVTEKKYDIEKSLKFQIEEAEKQCVQTFYISFHWQHDPVMSGMMGSWHGDLWIPADCSAFTSFGHLVCPTPHFNQMVYKYDHGHIKLMWFIPNHREFWEILKKERTVPEDVSSWVHAAYNGDLFKQVDKENHEYTVGKDVRVLDPNSV